MYLRMNHESNVLFVLKRFLKRNKSSPNVAHYMQPSILPTFTANSENTGVQKYKHALLNMHSNQG